MDGHSTDDTVRIANSLASKILIAEGGKAYARQIGFMNSTSEYVAFVDSDVLIPEHALKTMLEELITAHAKALTCLYLRNSLSNPTYWTNSEEQHHLYHRRWFHKHNLVTACSLFTRDVLISNSFELAYGGYMDDLDLGRRLQEKKEVIAVSRIVPTHLKSQNIQSYIKYHFLLGKTHHGYFRKYGFREFKYFPALSMMFWIEFCTVNLKLKLIPYFFVKGISESIGFASGPPT